MIAKKSSKYLGVGLYSIAEAARLVGVPPSAISDWADPEEGIVQRRLDPSEKTITFVELIELRFIQAFRKDGVSIPTIKRIATAASDRLKTDYPFGANAFRDECKSILASIVQKETDPTVLEDLRRAQSALATSMPALFKKLEYDKVDGAQGNRILTL